MINRNLNKPAQSSAPSNGEDSQNVLESNALEPNALEPNALEPSVSMPMTHKASNPLAGAFPNWDLVPPDSFVKRISRAVKTEQPAL